MGVSAADRDMVRRLAGEVAEIAALPVHAEKAELWRRLNGLETVRPLVWINEICWDEMGPEAQPQSRDPLVRGIEGRLRHVGADDVEPVQCRFFSDPLGLSLVGQRIGADPHRKVLGDLVTVDDPADTQANLVSTT